MSRAAAKNKKDPIVPESTAARPPPGVSPDRARAAFAGISKGRTVGFATSDNAGPPLAMPAAAVAAAARTPAAPQGPEVAPATAADDVTRPVQPSPPAAAPPQPAPPAAAPPQQPPATAPSSPPPLSSFKWAVPVPDQDPRTEATNTWQERLDQRGEYQRRRLSEQIPQGETQLVHVWFSVLAQGVPPQACTIWLTRSEPEPEYQMMISGDAVAGAQPDRALFRHVERNRRQAGIAESFVGRIRAPTVDGKVIELGGGMLRLPPDPQLAHAQHPGAAAAGPWAMAPGAGWTPPGPGGGGQWGTPPWMQGMPPWMQNMPPWMMGAGPWGGGMHGAPPWWGGGQWGGQQQVPDAIKGKPELVALFEVLQKMQHQPQDPNTQLLMTKLMEVAFRERPVEKPAGLLDQVEGIGKLVTALDAIRGKSDGDGGGNGITVTYVDDGAGGRTPIVAKGGEIDMSTTVGIPMVGALRKAGSAIGAKFAGGAPGGIAKGKSPQPAQVSTTTTTNGTGAK